MHFCEVVKILLQVAVALSVSITALRLSKNRFNIKKFCLLNLQIKYLQYFYSLLFVKTILLWKIYKNLTFAVKFVLVRHDLLRWLGLVLGGVGHV